MDPADLGSLKAGLHRLVHGGLDADAAGRLAADLDLALGALAGQVATGPVRVRVEGWPPGLDASQRSALLGRPFAGILEVGAAEAAELRAALHGRWLGGRRLEVLVELAPGEVLPAVPRSHRDRSRRGGPSTWLPHLDEEGRWSLSPRDLAERQAALLDTPVVIDAFCGCGGNAVAFALAGRRVVAIERDPGRLALAAANARALGVRLDLRQGDADDLLPALADAMPDAGLFLDPPWGGPEASGQPVGFADLVPVAPSTLRRFGPILLKAPRTFDLSTLPESWRWRWHFELGPPGADGRSVVQCISCVTSPCDAR